MLCLLFLLFLLLLMLLCLLCLLFLLLLMLLCLLFLMLLMLLLLPHSAFAQQVLVNAERTTKSSVLQARGGRERVGMTGRHRRRSAVRWVIMNGSRCEEGRWGCGGVRSEAKM